METLAKEVDGDGNRHLVCVWEDLLARCDVSHDDGLYSHMFI